MIQTLLLISRWIGQAHDQWRANTASRRPKAAEIDLLHEQVAQLRSENEIVKTRLLRLPPRKRPRFRPWQRIQILLHASRYAGEGLTELAMGSTVGIIPYNEVSSETRQKAIFRPESRSKLGWAPTGASVDDDLDIESDVLDGEVIGGAPTVPTTP